MKPILFEDLTVLYDDRHLVVLVKPTGIVCESTTDKTGLCDLLSGHYGKAIYTVHRLDTATGGVMVYAKTKEAASTLSKAIQNDGFHKTYLAIVGGKPKGNGTLTDYLFHDKTKNKSYVVKNERKGAKYAELDYEVLAHDENTDRSLIQVTLKTGRTHQIRVQFSSRGFPLLGDGRYGGEGHSPLALFCSGLSFDHPFTHETMVFTVKPGTPFEGFYNILL